MHFFGGKWNLSYQVICHEYMISYQPRQAQIRNWGEIASCIFITLVGCNSFMNIHHLATQQMPLLKVNQFTNTAGIVINCVQFGGGGGGGGGQNISNHSIAI